MNPSSDNLLANIFRPSVLAWRDNYRAAKAATAGPAPKPAPTAARRKAATSARR